MELNQMLDEVQQQFERYPETIQSELMALRSLILDMADELKLGAVSESLKWSEPSYQVKDGSPVRMGWKEKTPQQFYLFFHCQTQLVDTFRQLYADELEFEGNRAMVFTLGQPMPEPQIKHCLQLALTYHRVKHLPLLGA